MRLRCAMFLVLGADFESEDVIGEVMTENGLGMHELHVLALAEEVGTSGTLCELCGWVWFGDVAADSLRE